MEKIKCNLCNDDDITLVTRGRDRLYKIDKKLFDIVKCNSCGLVYMNPQPNQEELKKYYPSDYGPYKNDGGILRYGPILGYIKNKINHIKSVLKNSKEKKEDNSKTDESVLSFLDFGSGSGAHLEKMKRLHPRWDLYGLDNNEFACANTKEKGFNVYCGDILNIDLPLDFFDRVYMGQVVEHLNDPKTTLKKVNSIMKSGGEFTLATPNVDSFAARLFGKYWFALDVPRHLFLFSPKTLSKMLRDTGFEVVSITYDKDPKNIIRSILYVFNMNVLSINPLLWHIFWYILIPISTFLSFGGKTSAMTIQAKKI